jgi:hypothetical protein
MTGWQLQFGAVGRELDKLAGSWKRNDAREKGPVHAQLGVGA